MGLSHINKEGRAHMVSVTNKKDTFRKAVANGTVVMEIDTLKRIIEGGMKKGDVLAVAQVAGIMAAKKTSELIPMCHPLLINGVDIDIQILNTEEIEILCSVEIEGKTGVEMEALTGASVTALTVYDMCKSISQKMLIKEVKLVEKTGGKSDMKN